jgi:hypothetical protein
MESVDINDYGLGNEYFGFDNNYQQMPFSNTEFLNFFEGRKQKKELDAIRAKYFQKIDSLPPTDEAGRNALFSELEQKLKEKGASFDEINAATKEKRKAERGGKIAQGLTSALNVFNKAAGAMRMGQQVEGNQQYKSGSVTDSNKIPMWVWVSGGVLIIGLGILAVMKMKK